jgi:hypothetical protein
LLQATEQHNDTDFRGAGSMNWSTVAAGMAIAAMSVGVTACGSSSSSSAGDGGGGDKGLSRTALNAKVDAICTKAVTASQAIEAPASFEDATVAAKYFDAVAPITDSETTAILALEPADDVKADFTAFSSAQSEANTLLQTIKAKADSQDASGMDDLSKVAPAGAKVSAAAKKLGATTCG